MSLENLVLALDPLMNEYQLLSSELERLNSLYTEVQEEKALSKNTARGSTVFVSQQNQVLNSVATSRISVISKMADIRRNIEELKIKEFNANKSLKTDENGVDSALVKEMLSTIFAMKDAELSQFIPETEEIQPGEVAEEAEANLAEALALISDYSPDSNPSVEEDSPEAQYETLKRITDKELLEVVYDVTTSKFLVLSTAPTDSGSLVSEIYLQNHAPELLPIISTLTVQELDMEAELVVTNLKTFPLVETA